MGAATTRRELLQAGLGGAAALYGLEWARGLEAALAAPAAAGRLRDIEHVVIFVQENRSFDHYFGTYRGVRGFADPEALPLPDGSGLTVFAQPGYPAPGYGGHLFPFRLDPGAGGECTHDLTHDWGPQHRAWAGGAIDAFVREHLAAEGDADGPLTMGYYRRADLASTTRSPTPSRSATATTARSSAPPTPTSSTSSRERSTPRASTAGRSWRRSRAPARRASARCRGRRCPSSCARGACRGGSTRAPTTTARRGTSRSRSSASTSRTPTSPPTRSARPSLTGSRRTPPPGRCRRSPGSGARSSRASTRPPRRSTVSTRPTSSCARSPATRRCGRRRRCS